MPEPGLQAWVPAEAIDRPGDFAGSLPVAALSRLTETLASQDGSLQVRLFLSGRSPGQPPRVQGQVRGKVQRICQRCLGVFEQTVDLPIDVLLARSEAEEARLAENAEVILIEGDRLSLHDLVEDELLLSLPIAPRCEVDCASPERSRQGE